MAVEHAALDLTADDTLLDDNLGVVLASHLDSGAQILGYVDLGDPHARARAGRQRRISFGLAHPKDCRKRPKSSAANCT